MRNLGIQFYLRYKVYLSNKYAKFQQEAQEQEDRYCYEEHLYFNFGNLIYY